MSEYFPNPILLGENVKVELDLSNFAPKYDLENATGVDTSTFVKKVDLASLISEIDQLDIDKLETTPVNLSKLSDIVKNQVVKDTKYDELVKKFNAIQTTNTINLLEKTDYDTKIGEIEKKILSNNHGKYNTTQEFNKITAEQFTATLEQANLATKADIDDFVEKTGFDNKLKNLIKIATSNQLKHILVVNELDELSEKVELISTKGLTKDLVNGYSIFKDAKSSDVLKNYLIFISANK